MTHTSHPRPSRAGGNPSSSLPLSKRGKLIPQNEQGDFERILDDLWSQNEAELRRDHTPDERLFLLGRKDAINEMTGKVGITQR